MDIQWKNRPSKAIDSISPTTCIIAIIYLTKSLLSNYLTEMTTSAIVNLNSYIQCIRHCIVEYVQKCQRGQSSNYIHLIICMQLTVKEKARLRRTF